MNTSKEERHIRGWRFPDRNRLVRQVIGALDEAER